MKVVGLDLSLRATGYCHADGSTETLSSKLPGIGRIVDLREQISRRLQSDAVTLVALEEYAFSRGGHAHEIGELGGVVKVQVLLPNFTYVLIPIGTLKVFATGKGNSKKTAMALAAAKFGREFPNDDDNQCDAWWLQQIALYRYDASIVTQTAYRDEAVSKIAWPPLEVSA